MKLRQGFISNSSTTAFVFFGYLFPKEDFNELEILTKFHSMEKLDQNAMEEYNQNWNDLSEDDQSDLFCEISQNENPQIFTSEEDGMPENKIGVGIRHRIREEDNPEIMKLSEITEQLKQLNISENHDDIVVIHGHYCS